MRSRVFGVAASAVLLVTGLVAGCGSEAGSAPCTPSCNGRHCGDDGCGGSCGEPCAAPLLCENTSGQCVSRCGAGQTLCGQNCAALASDSSNCGACGTICSGGEACLSGRCQSPPEPCLAGTTAACTCPGTGTGTKTCNAAGNGYGACDCAWKTNIEHVVLIVQENHTFDSYFGRYCTGATGPGGAPPTCNAGPSCCDAPPAKVGTVAPFDLTDAENYNYDRDHNSACEICEMKDAMVHFVDGSCVDPNPPNGLFSYGCSSPHNFGLAPATSMTSYWRFAGKYALADRYFQPLAGGTSGNDMYFAVAHYEFTDNDVAPSAIGQGCTDPVSKPTVTKFSDRTTIADVLTAHGRTFKTYADGYADAVAAAPRCPAAGGAHCHPFFNSACKYDPSDVPFNYYFPDEHIADVETFATDLANGALPSLAFVKYRTSENEHPGWSYVTEGEGNVTGIINKILASSVYANNTLILLTWDEGGGFYDHVAPPASVEKTPQGADVPYGTRVPFLAIGAFAKTNYVSHRPMEHSSIVKFLEWNFVGPSGVGAIAATYPSARDGSAAVSGIGDMLDGTKVGVNPP